MRPGDLPAARISFSQHGEDLLIFEHLFWMRREPRGIYVDAGCFDPWRYSNTRLLSLLGWKGVNIDASESAIAAFRAARPGDDSVVAALAEAAGEDEFIETRSGAGSRLARGGVPRPAGAGEVGRTRVATRTLREVLDASRFSGEPVDFLDIDCEGADLAVLRGFGLDVRRPFVICIEAHGEEEGAEVGRHLGGHGYEFVCRRGPSLLYRDPTGS